MTAHCSEFRVYVTRRKIPMSVWLYDNFVVKKDPSMNAEYSSDDGGPWRSYQETKIDLSEGS